MSVPHRAGAAPRSDAPAPHGSSPEERVGAAMDEATRRRERIIQAAYATGERGGLAAISARGVARDADMSVGYLYKLFPSKSDIVVAAAQRYFKRALTQELCHTEAGEAYSDYCHRLWEHTQRAFATFMRDWLRDREELSRQDLAAAHTAMASVLSDARVELERVLRRDERINWGSMPEGADAPSIAELTMRSLLDSLKKGDEDCAVLLALYLRGEARAA